jgi:hypothetical protein
VATGAFTSWRANPANHFIVVSQGDLDEDGIAVVVLAKKTPFTLQEEQAVHDHLDSHDSWSRYTCPRAGPESFSA